MMTKTVRVFVFFALLALGFSAAVLAQPQLQYGVFRLVNIVSTATDLSFFQSSANGKSSLWVRSTTAGATNGAAVDIGNDAATQTTRLMALSSTHSTTSYLAPSITLLEANGADLRLATSTASPIVFYTNSTERLRVSTTGTVIGSTGTAIVSVFSASATWDPGSVADGAATSASLTVTGVSTTSVCFAGHTQASTNAIALTAHPSAADTVRLVLTNNSGGAVDLASGTVRATCFTH